ncbi:hypothetical protein J4462_00990 [Candidatus Pacearchaeota archaeon]|nr:hypothetical protein [Candidatus Pacearchaeota archaeon]
MKRSSIIIKTALAAIITTAGSIFSCNKEDEPYLSILIRSPISSSLPETFVTEDSPKEYVEIFQPNKNLTLDDFLTDDAAVFPEDKKFLVSYITSKPDENGIVWCPNCAIVEKQNFLKNTLDLFGDEIAVAKTEVPIDSKPLILEKIHDYSGIPDIRIYEIGEDKKLTFLRRVSGPWEDINKTTKQLLGKALVGKLKPHQDIRLGEKDIRNYQLGFDVTDGQDFEAILFGLTLLKDPSKISYSPSTKELTFQLDLMETEHASFAREYDLDFTEPRNTNRNVMDGVNRLVVNAYFARIKSDPNAGKIVDEIDKDLERFGSQDLTALSFTDLLKFRNSYNDFRWKYWEFTKIGMSSTVPQPFGNVLSNFFHQKREEVNGSAKTYSLYEILNHPELRKEINNWAERGGKNVNWIRPLTDEQLKDLANTLQIPRDHIDRLREHQQTTQSAYESLQHSDIIYTCPFAPLEPILSLANKDRNVFCIGEGSTDHVISTLKNHEKTQGTESMVMLEILLRGSEHAKQEGLSARFFYIPWNKGRNFGWIYPPRVSTTSLLDPYADKTNTTAIIVFSNDQGHLLTENISPYGIDMTQRLKIAIGK